MILGVNCLPAVLGGDLSSLADGLNLSGVSGLASVLF